MLGLFWSLLASAAPAPGGEAISAWPGYGPYTPAINRFYASTAFRALWFPDGHPSAKATELLHTLSQAADEGLNPADYRPQALQKACMKAAPPNPAACELAFTSSFLRYAQDVGYGVYRAAELDPHWHIPQQTLPARALLERLATSDDVATLLAQLPPPHPAYQRLRAALAEYRDPRNADQWISLPAGPILRPGDRGTRVRLLRRRLGAQQPALLDSALPSRYDNELLAAVERFQAHHGLQVDGIVGPETRAALNVPRARRIAQIALNMERWRWLPRQLGDTHILVNLAGFHLTLNQPGQAPLRLRIISGRRDRTSPAFRSRLSYLVLNPEWTVPRRIAVEDLLPQLQRNPLALAHRHIHILRREGGELVEVDPAMQDWGRYNRDNFPFLLRQSPGPDNAMGQIKFMMPNPYAIYIHDTPAKALFRKSVRTFSSGCIRVERPLELAIRLLGGDQADAAHYLHELLDTGETLELPIRPAVPVYLTYLTAWVDQQGNLYRYDDVYGRDAPLAARFIQLRASGHIRDK